MNKTLQNFSLHELLGIPISQEHLLNRLLREKLNKRKNSFTELDDDFHLTGISLRDKKRIIVEVLQKYETEATSQKKFYKTAVWYAKNDQWEELVAHWKKDAKV